LQKAEEYAVDVDAALREHSNTVYKIALSQTKNSNDADDVFQEVFMRLVTNSHKIVSKEHLKAWLIRVTLNCCKKHFKFWRTGNAELVEDIPYFTPEEHEAYYAVLALPQKYRTVIHMFYYEELSVKQISGILDTKESTVKSQLFRAREMLREALKGEFGDNV
jgi:RNA polymerase sigma-70 factor (ECF subfamily)